MGNSINLNLAYKIKWAYTALTILIIWFALVLQFAISIPAYIASGLSIGGAVVQILSFFTILSNLLAVIALTVLLIKRNSAWGRFFSSGSVLTGICLYITVVGLVYNIVLRHLWAPQGWFKLADELLHTVNPILYIIYWLAFAPKYDLKWTQAFPWLWYPFIYLIYVLIRGALYGGYPYPFVDVAKLGYLQVILNSLVLLLVFLGLGMLFIFIGRALNKPEFEDS